MLSLLYCLGISTNYFLGDFPNAKMLKKLNNLYMTKEEAIKKAGSQAKLAKLLGVTRGAIYHWKDIPALRIYQLKELKPDWFGL